MHEIDKQYWIVVIVIIFGAIVHATTQFKKNRDMKQDFTLLDFVILFIIACFSGMIFGLVALMFNFGMIQIILSSAIGSFLGLMGLDKMATMILDFILSRKMETKGPQN